MSNPMEELIHLWDNVDNIAYTSKCECEKNIILSPNEIKLMADIGMECYRGEKNTYTWNGKKLNLSMLPSSDWILHEICHYLVSSNERRKIPNYGLGEDPNQNKLETPDLTMNGIEDMAVCILEFYYLKHWQLIFPNSKHLEWFMDKNQFIGYEECNSYNSNIKSLTKRLQEINLINDNCVPTGKKNMSGDITKVIPIMNCVYDKIDRIYECEYVDQPLSLIHISEPTRRS